MCRMVDNGFREALGREPRVIPTMSNLESFQQDDVPASPEAQLVSEGGEASAQQQLLDRQ